MKSMKRYNTACSAMLLGLTLLAGCSTIHHKEAPAAASGSEGDAAVSFPDPSHATMPEGIFVNLENLRKIAPGMTKDQLHNLLGTPHFNEGVFGVRKWNYILDFRKADGSGNYFSCQYQIRFDSNGHAENFYWKPASCKSVLDIAVPPPAPVVPTPAVMPNEPIRLSSDALFKFDRSDLTPEGRDRLSQLLQQVQSASQIQNILVIGYTDRIGSDSYNLALSRRRAESVRDFLVAGGVPAADVQVEGHGKADPIVQCSDARRAALIACLAPNRRVELSGRARSH